jgi:hypothetical protein
VWPRAWCGDRLDGAGMAYLRLVWPPPSEHLDGPWVVEQGAGFPGHEQPAGVWE